MPDFVELPLFRVVQEGLINVHRHSGSQHVDIRIERDEARIVVRLKDYGKGLPGNLLERFRKTGSGAGVGLSGMRERVKELGGELVVESDETGTLLTVITPLAATPVGNNSRFARKNPTELLEGVKRAV
jgi:signal transduction histidine kinase